ncbi:unnamed protein product [marine sediment metagenome]|uniref:Uncharacterized protein n=1 Tax=marine sediment metagenome TaxID=412755 RepID=X0V979_9ZZZZ
MQESFERVLEAIRDAWPGLECWHQSSGGCVGATFSLAFGARIPRKYPVTNPCETDEFRQNTGEVNLLVWCTWRLDSPQTSLASSDEMDECIGSALQALIGAKVTAVSIELPAWDLAVKFSNDQTLKVFCDHLPGDPSFDGNWEIDLPDLAYYFGPGGAMEVQERSDLS